MTTLDMVKATGLVPRYMEWCVAGGYAADPVLASDCDIWIHAGNANARRDVMLQHLKDGEFEFVEAEDDRGDSTYPESIVVRKIATVTGRPGAAFPKPVHLLAYEGTVTDLLESFDVSTHQVALVVGPQWTPVSQVPVALKDTPSTPARIEKITERYAHMRAL